MRAIKHAMMQYVYYYILSAIFYRRFMIGQYVTVHGDVISHLNISETQVEDGGIYGCEAKNRQDGSI